MPSEARGEISTRHSSLFEEAHVAAGRHKKLVIGIDYGTTNSGVAYAVVTDNKSDNIDVNIIRDWPHGVREEKIPSDIAYDTAGNPVGYAFEFPDGAQPLQWVKLLLEPVKLGKSRQGNDRVWRSYDELNKLGKLPIDAISDYLRWLWTQIERSLEDCGDGLDTDETVVVLTLPASWSDQAKHRMLQAAQKAGIDSNGRILKFRVEPEAAALFELKARAKKGQIAVGDCFVVCDAGGGTVDVVTFQVGSLDPLSLNQVVVAEADFCGSAFINAEFEAQLRFFLGSDYEKLSNDAKDQIRDKFENRIKRKYNPAVPAEYTVPVTGLEDNPAKGIKDGRLLVKESILQRCFDEIMTQVLTLIDEQKNGLKTQNILHRLKAILIVGGFGSSEYLHTRIRQEYPSNENVRVWRGAQSWTAVVQGAVQCEVATQQTYAPFKTRLSRFHYGIPYHKGSVQMVHWFIHKGEDMRDSSHIEPYLLRLEDRDWLDDVEYATISVQLVRSSKDTVTENDDSSLEPHVDMDCRIPTAIRFSPDAEMIQTRPIKIWRIPAELILTMDGPLLTIRCRIQGKDVGLLDLKYHDEPESLLYRDTSIQKMQEPLQPDTKVEGIYMDKINPVNGRYNTNSQQTPGALESSRVPFGATMINATTATLPTNSQAAVPDGTAVVVSPTSKFPPKSAEQRKRSTYFWKRSKSVERKEQDSPKSIFSDGDAMNGFSERISGQVQEPLPLTQVETRSTTSSQESTTKKRVNKIMSFRRSSNEQEIGQTVSHGMTVQQASSPVNKRPDEEWIPYIDKKTGEEMLRSRITGQKLPAPSKHASGYGLHGF